MRHDCRGIGDKAVGEHDRAKQRHHREETVEGNACCEKADVVVARLLPCPDQNRPPARGWDRGLCQRGHQSHAAVKLSGSGAELLSASYKGQPGFMSRPQIWRRTSWGEGILILHVDTGVAGTPKFPRLLTNEVTPRLWPPGFWQLLGRQAPSPACRTRFRDSGRGKSGAASRRKQLARCSVSAAAQNTRTTSLDGPQRHESYPRLSCPKARS